MCPVTLPITWILNLIYVFSFNLILVLLTVKKQMVQCFLNASTVILCTYLPPPLLSRYLLSSSVSLDQKPLW